MKNIIEITKCDKIISQYDKIQYIKVDEKIFNYFKGKSFWNGDKTVCIYFFKYNPFKQIFLYDNRYSDNHMSEIEDNNSIYTLILKDDSIKDRLLFKNIINNFYAKYGNDIDISIKENVKSIYIDKCDYESLIKDLIKNLVEIKLKLNSELIKLLTVIKNQYSKETNDEKSFIELGTSFEKVNVSIIESIKSVKINPKFFEMAFANDNILYQFRNIKFEKISHNTEVSISAGTNDEKIIFTFSGITKELKYMTDYYELEFDIDEFKLLKLNEVCSLYNDLSYFTNITNFEMELKCTHKYI